MSEEPGTTPQDPIDSATEWVAKNIAEYVATDGKVGSKMREAPLLLLTTQGRKSGKWRRTALIFGESEGRYLIVASKAGAPKHPSWYLNLKSNPEVHVQVYDHKFVATAHTAGPEEKPSLWATMVGVWPDYAEYQKKTTRDIPVVVLTPAAG